ncbi:MAG TPA: hypothetical protein VGG03_08470 [Thermoanaerobaculia bacterium]|jgi:hypothetical protein
MIREDEVRQKLAELLSGELGLEEFEDWLVQRSWNMHLDSSAGAQDLVSAIELAPAEHSSGHLSEAQLREELLSLLDNVVVAAKPTSNLP